MSWLNRHDSLPLCLYGRNNAPSHGPVSPDSDAHSSLPATAHVGSRGPVRGRAQNSSAAGAPPGPTADPTPKPLRQRPGEAAVTCARLGPARAPSRAHRWAAARRRRLQSRTGYSPSLFWAAGPASQARPARLARAAPPCRAASRWTRSRTAQLERQSALHASPCAQTGLYQR